MLELGDRVKDLKEHPADRERRGAASRPRTAGGRQRGGFAADEREDVVDCRAGRVHRRSISLITRSAAAVTMRPPPCSGTS